MGNEHREARRRQPHWVYRMFDEDGALLYIGQTYNPAQRIAGWYSAARNSSRSRWFGQVRSISWQWHPHWAAAVAAEKEAIEVERPRHNRDHQPRPLPLPHQPKVTEGMVVLHHVALMFLLDRASLDITWLAAVSKVERSRIEQAIDSRRSLLTVEEVRAIAGFLRCSPEVLAPELTGRFARVLDNSTLEAVSV